MAAIYQYFKHKGHKGLHKGSQRFTGIIHGNLSIF